VLSEDEDCRFKTPVKSATVYDKARALRKINYRLVNG
jgi:hypothetical protein